ncbi:Rho termination factor N-terminal domain-containing protein [Bernardetia sp.]|uniref:Rho termination factor N-terminal domain-containing protein n=1 Tax=Bernardetia sp. TaxID=1937974 RepID=UPI0025C0EDBB|nr:Rho termination factor N-terminal domain-containing protein [Bernardetia sp.]
MIIKSLLEIAFYGSWVAVKKVGATLEEKLPFSKEKIKPVRTRTVDARLETAKEEKQQKKAPIEDKKITPKQEAKILNYKLKTKKELYEIAQEIDLEGRSTMNKSELITALEEHTRNNG